MVQEVSSSVLRSNAKRKIMVKSLQDVVSWRLVSFGRHQCHLIRLRARNRVAGSSISVSYKSSKAFSLVKSTVGALISKAFSFVIDGELIVLGSEIFVLIVLHAWFVSASKPRISTNTVMPMRRNTVIR